MAEVKYPSNSFKDAQKQSNGTPQKKNVPASRKPKKVSPVVKGAVKTKKKSEFSKIKEMFFAQDVGSIKNYVIMDVIVPAVKKAICDTIKDSVDMLFYGKTMPRRKGNNNGIVNFRDYASVSRRSFDLPARRTSSSSVYEYDGIVFESRSDAEDVLDALSEILEQYDDVTVADLFQLAGQTPNSTDSDYGWDNIATARVERLDDGMYTVVMPRVKRI